MHQAAQRGDSVGRGRAHTRHLSRISHSLSHCRNKLASGINLRAPGSAAPCCPSPSASVARGCVPHRRAAHLHSTPRPRAAAPGHRRRGLRRSRSLLIAPGCSSRPAAHQRFAAHPAFRTAVARPKAAEQTAQGRRWHRIPKSL